jgi:ribonuclease-3
MDESASPEELQELIGYQFHELENLESALTRRGYLKENLSNNENHMDPLATLGDAILSAVVVYALYEKGNRQKGTLTADKILSVNRATTRAFAKKHHLQRYIHWGKGEIKNEIWNLGNQAFDTAFEALIGAVFLDAQTHEGNGIAAVTKMLKRLKYIE